MLSIYFSDCKEFRSENAGKRGQDFVTPSRWQQGREPGPSRECHPENGGHASLREARMRKAKDAAAAAAKSLQSCPTPCDPIDGSPPGSAIPGILQARALEWVAISFSNG